MSKNNNTPPGTNPSLEYISFALVLTSLTVNLILLQPFSFPILIAVFSSAAPMPCLRQQSSTQR